MSAWSDRNGGTPAVAGATGSRQFNNSGVGLPSGSGGVYHPTPSGTPPAAEAGNPDVQPGVVSINPLNPAGSLQGSADPISQLFNGLRQATVGGNGEAGAGSREHSLVGGIPVLGDLGRGLADVVGGGGEVLGAAVNTVGGTLERVDTSGTAFEQAWQQARAKANETEGGRKLAEEAQALIDKEHGLFGTGLLDNDAHIKSVYMRKIAEEAQYAHPSLAPGAFTPPGSLADSLGSLMDVLGVSATVAAKGWAQLDTPGQSGMDRIDLITAVGDQQATFNEDKGLLNTGILAGDPTTGLNQMEQLVYNKMKNGDWTRDEAADFLASNGQAFGHSAIANIGGGLALDPLNAATFGAGAIAKVGARGVMTIAKLEQATARLAEVGKALEESEAALQAARGSKAVKGAAAVKGAGRGTVRQLTAARDAAKADVEAAQTSLNALNTYRSGGSIRGLNFGARAVEGSDKVQSGFKLAGKAYGALEDNAIGKAAKVIRTTIDPLHALDLHMPGANKLVDVYADAVPRSIVDTMGVQHYKGMLDDALRLDHTGGMYNQIADDIGVASSNMAREGVTDLYRAGQLAGNLGEKLMKKLPGDVFETAIQSIKQRDLNKWLRYNALKHVAIETWDEGAHNSLARDLEQTYHTRTAAEWTDAFKTMSKEQKSLYKFAVYGNTNRRLLDFVGNMAPETAALLPVPPGRMVLLAKGTLTRVGGESLLTKLSKPKLGRNAKLKLIADAQQRYPSLRYVSIDPAHLERSIDQFIETLNEGLDRLPMQMTDDEVANLGPAADDLTSSLGTYSLGFKPEDRFLWGLERGNGDGLYHVASPAWADHVADGAIGYRPAAALRLNIAGHPLVDVPVVRAAIRAVDHMDSAARLMKTQVTSAMVTEAARKRFLSEATKAFSDHDVTDRVAQDWFDRITSYTREHQGYSGPRGMGGDDLYGAIKRDGLIPQPLLNGERKLNPDDVMGLVLRAYDGDMRYIGLTQKLSGRAKRVLFEATGSNWAGQIAEHAWPTLKFRYNPIFQLQEKVEPWVLNAQRGVSFATGVNMSEADRLTERLLQRMTDNSLVRQADLDQFEYSSAVLFGKTMERTAGNPATRLSRIKAIGGSLTEVQGMKRLNMLRTFRKGLGKEVKGAWEAARPGDWEKMKDAADIRTGRILDEDDFALQVISENLYSNDIAISRIESAAGKFGQKAEWGNAIKTGAWHTPTTLGELKALDLDHVAESLRIANGKGEDIKDLNQLRQALATERGTMDKVVDGLTRLGAHPDYIRRVRNGLDFHWNGFWKTAEKRFGLTTEESGALQDMMSEAAQLRGMSPVEFMSQVFSPSLIDGTEGTLGHLEGTVRILRDARAAGRKVKGKDAKLMESRTLIAGKEGVSTREDFVRQLSRTFSAHLDPSAKRALLQEFNPELRQAVNDGKLQLDLQEVQDMWDDLSDNALADRILGYMDGKPGAAGHDVVTDSARGVEGVRASATKYMEKQGVTPLADRRYYHADEDLSQRTADAYQAMPTVEYEKTGAVPKVSTINKASTELKPKPEGVDQRTYDSYRDLVIETRAQWDHITGPKSKGGLGLKVTVSKTDPYPDSAAMRADVAKGKLRVFGGDSDHPLMTNDQNVMFRAVHDVYGHAAEGHEFGPRGELNASIKHSQMYSDTARPAMLTETHGQNSYVNFSNEVIADEGAPPFVLGDDPAAEFEAAFPFKSPDYEPGDIDSPNLFEVTIRGDNWKGDEVPKELFLDQKVGSGLQADVLPVDGPGGSRELLETVGGIQRQFPDFQVVHIDSPPDWHAPVDFAPEGHGVDPSISGMTWGADDNESLVFISPDMMGDQHYDYMKVTGFRWRGTKAMGSFKYDYHDGLGVTKHARQSNPGVPWNFSYGPNHVAAHELGHVIDSALLPDQGLAVRKVINPAHQAYEDFVNDYLQSEARANVSEYGFTSPTDGMAELFAVAFNPETDRAALHPTVLDAVEQLEKVLEDIGVYKPLKGKNPLAGLAVKDANRLKPGSVYAPQKAGLLPQDLLDEFGSKFVGKGKHVESNPDVARAAQMFGKWTDAVVTNGLLKGDQSVHAGILHDIAGLPTHSAVPYNYTEGAIASLAQQAMVRKWDDAFRLQYFSQERSFLERSLNHPMFGMYPASYMWGKIMPEMVRFLALEPFGNKTGGLLRSALDVQQSIALRREYDPYFDAHMEELGHAQALSFAGYLLPTLPWDISASAPGWMRSIASQGAANEGKTAEQGADVSLVAPATDTFKKLAPLTTTLPWAGRAVDELTGTPTDKEAAKSAADLNKAVKAAELQPTMQRVLQELQEALR